MAADCGQRFDMATGYVPSLLHSLRDAERGDHPVRCLCRCGSVTWSVSVGCLGREAAGQGHHSSTAPSTQTCQHTDVYIAVCLINTGVKYIVCHIGSEADF